MRKSNRLWDMYRYPGHEPESVVKGVFGDPYVRVIRLRSRGKNGRGACGRTHRSVYDRKGRRVRDLSCGDRRICLDVEVRRVLCGSCGKVKQKKLDWLANAPFSTKRFAFWVGRRCRVMSIQAVTRETHLGWKEKSPIIQHFFKLSVVAIVMAASTLTVTSCSDSSKQVSLGDSIESAVEKTMSENGIPGAIVGVWSPSHGDLIIVRGKADIETGRGMDSVDRVRIASITKTFTITVILELVDEGNLELDQTLSTWFPTIPGSDEITVRELCNMTSGLFNYSDDPTFQKVYSEDPNKVWSPEELVALAVAHPPYFAPGTSWHYSNTNTIILGMIINKITGRMPEDEIKDRIVDRLKLENTYYPDGTSIEGVHSHGYVAGETAGTLADVTEKLNPSGMGASGALISNLADLKTWMTACANGDLLSSSTQKQRTTLVEGDYEYGGKKIKYGLGIMSAYGFLGHPGDGVGNTNAAFHSPENGTTIVVLLNKGPNQQEAAALSLFMDIAQIMFPARSIGP